MRRSFYRWSVGAVVVSLIGLQQASSRGQQGAKELAITTADLRGAVINGDLGVPLGTLVVVEGRYQDMTFTGRKADAGRIELVIDRVNEKKLDRPERFTFREDASLIEWIHPRDGERFKLIGYEYGHVFGDVEGEDKYKAAVGKALRPFGYYSDFAPLKNVSTNQEAIIQSSIK